MKRVKDKKKNTEEKGKNPVYISWTDPSVPICEIQVAFSTHSVDPQAFYKCSEPMLLTLNLPINKHLLVFIIEAAQKLGEGNSTSLQYSCLENPMDRGAW